MVDDESKDKDATFWRRCGSCKAPIAFGVTYWICSVSTCQRGSTGPTPFCKPDCWAVHNEIENHRNGFCEERKAPKTKDAPVEPERKAKKEDGPEILVVVSYIKDFLDGLGGMSGGDDVMARLSDHVRFHCEKGIDNAKRGGRKTVMARDIPRPAPKSKDAAILVVVSRVKAFIKAAADVATSDEVPPVLSEELRKLLTEAAERAKKDGRKTLQARDLPTPGQAPLPPVIRR